MCASACSTLAKRALRSMEHADAASCEPVRLSARAASCLPGQLRRLPSLSRRWDGQLRVFSGARRRRTAGPLFRFSAGTGRLAMTAPTASGAVVGPLAVSPDGRRIAIVATSADGKSQLWVRSLDTLTAQALAGTEGAFQPFWSPDSRFIGFFAGGKLKKIEVSGGPPITLCDAPDPRGGTWNRDGVIVFGPTATFGTPESVRRWRRAHRSHRARSR